MIKHLEEAACSESLPGPVVQIHRGRRAITVNTDDATIQLNNGEVTTADVIIAAESLHSFARTSMTQKSYLQTASHESLPISPETNSQTNIDNFNTPVTSLDNNVRIFAAKGCAVVVTTSGGERSVNIVKSDVSGNREYSEAAILDNTKGLNYLVSDAIENCKEEAISISSHVGTDIVPAWTENRLAFIGDAACHYPPYLLYGTAMAIEDAVSLGVLLSGLNTKEDILERLNIFNEMRRSRVTKLREHSRNTWSGLESGQFKREDSDFAFSHDEIHHARQMIRLRLWGKAPRLSWRQPVGFGPMMSPRQHISRSISSNPRPDRLGEAQSLTASIRFRTSKTLLGNLLPSDKYSFSKRGSVAEASFVFQSIENLAWLGGGGYNLVLFQVHGIQHKSSIDSTTRDGCYVALVLEDLADPIVSGREDLGWPKLYSDIGVRDNMKSGGSLSVTLSWRGSTWLSLFWNGLQSYQQSPQPLPSSAEHVFVHKYIPATAEIPNRQVADADYDVLMPPTSPASRPIQWQHNATDSEFIVESRLEHELPTLWHVAHRLAELPNFGVVEARVGTKQGQDDFSGAIKV